jgi:hypothetical protein
LGRGVFLHSKYNVINRPNSMSSKALEGASQVIQGQHVMVLEREVETYRRELARLLQEGAGPLGSHQRHRRG